jgi:hypothetical protein
MECIKIGLLRETKTPPDRRIALSPKMAAELISRYPQLDIVVQPSSGRCFADHEFIDAGIRIQEDLSDCDLLFGVKEVGISAMMEGKHYLFFAHVAKKQEYNRSLLQALLDKKVTLTDYEYLTDNQGIRLIAFGRWAGIIGAYNGLRTWGLKNNLFVLKPPHACHDRMEMDEYLKGIDPGKIRILITGGGRVAHGVMETLGKLGIPEVSPDEFLARPDLSPVICRLDPEHYVTHVDNVPFRFDHFCQNPGMYKSRFNLFYPTTDLLYAAHYWDPRSPRLWMPEEMRRPDFRIRVIADISCDINGAVPSTIRATTIAEPFYDWNPHLLCETLPFADPGNITVMAIDNLPGELPRDASSEFGRVLSDKIIPCLLGDDPDHVIERATITRNGSLTERFSYLGDFVRGIE